jgi:hypothetical protein
VFAVNFDGLLRAFDATTGALLWSTQLPGQLFFDSPPTASGGMVYVVGQATGTTLYAVDEQDGTVKWDDLFDSGSDSSPAVTSNGVFVSFSCNETYDLSPQDGSLIWQHLGCSGGSGSTPVLFGGRLHVGDSLTEKLMFDAPTGAVLGTFAPGPPPAFSGSTGFFLTGSILKARDAFSGAVRWSFTGDGTLSSAPIVDNGYVYIGSKSGKVYALDATTGENVWTGNLGAVVQVNESLVTRPHTGLGAGDGLVVVPASTLLVAYQAAAQPSPSPTPTPTPTPTPGPLQLFLDESGPALDQVAALDSILFTRDPFPVVNTANLLNPGVDRNTRVLVFAINLQLLPGESSSAVTVSLVDSNNQSFDIPAEDVRAAPNFPFTQVVFRLPDNIAVGACTITLKAHGQTSNSGSIRIRN